MRSPKLGPSIVSPHRIQQKTLLHRNGVLGEGNRFSLKGRRILSRHQIDIIHRKERVLIISMHFRGDLDVGQLRFEIGQCSWILEVPVGVEG